MLVLLKIGCDDVDIIVLGRDFVKFYSYANVAYAGIALSCSCFCRFVLDGIFIRVFSEISVSFQRSFFSPFLISSL